VREVITKSTGKDPVKEIESEWGVNFKKDIAPALPREFTVAVSAPGTGEKTPSVVLAGRPGNWNKARNLAAKLRKNAEKKGIKFAEEKYGGTVIVHESGKESGAAYAFEKKSFLVGSSVSSLKMALDASRSPEKNLQSSADFQGLFKRLKGEKDIWVYMDAASWMQATMAMGGMAAGIPGAPGALRVEPPQVSAEQLKLLQGNAAVVGVDFTPKGMEMESISVIGEGMKKQLVALAGLPGVNRDFLGRLAGGPMAMLAISSPAKMWEAMKDIFMSTPEMAQAMKALKAGVSQVGLDFDRDIIGWMKGTTAVGVYYNVKPVPDFMIAWDVANREEVKAALGRLTQALTKATKGEIQFGPEEKQGTTILRMQSAALAQVPFLKPVFALTDKTLFFHSLESGMTAAEGEKKGSAADLFAQLPKEAQSVAMFDVPVFAGLLTDVAPFLTMKLSAEKRAEAQTVISVATDLLGSFGKVTGFSQALSDGSSQERWSVPMGYQSMVKSLKEWKEKAGASPSGAGKGKVPG